MTLTDERPDKSSQRRNSVEVVTASNYRLERPTYISFFRVFFFFFFFFFFPFFLSRFFFFFDDRFSNNIREFLCVMQKSPFFLFFFIVIKLEVLFFFFLEISLFIISYKSNNYSLIREN